jgi:trans-2,3-dihydro-3-hydroxyanthranilate isomerase
MKKLPFRIVNVFVESDAAAFGGNPLAVFEDGRGLSDAVMQAVASQFNLSETTFIMPRGGADPEIRIFTPRYELPFAGHPTVGTSYVIAAMRNASGIPCDRLRIKTKAGDIDVVRENGVWTFTANTHSSRPINASKEMLATAVGLNVSDFASDAKFVSTGTEQLVIPVASIDALARAKPVPELLQQYFSNDAGIYMAYLVARVSRDRFQARFFFPTASGASEDPGTGSACSNLGGFLVDSGEAVPAQITVTQGEFINRLNVLQLSLTNERRVRVGGRVVEIGSGELALA